MFCERCGLSFLPRQSVCTRCGEASTRHWLQLISVVTLSFAFVANRLVAFYLLPARTSVPHARLFFRSWAWFDQKFAWYGWLPFALGLLAWDLFVWRYSRPKVKGWLTRKLLTFAIVAGVTPVIPAWLPAGQPSDHFMAMVNKYPGMLSSFAWAVVVLVITLLVGNAETRDSLLGHGKVLSIVSLSVLLVLLTLTIVGWTLA
jgi:hypothetical protein